MWNLIYQLHTNRCSLPDDVTVGDAWIPINSNDTWSYSFIKEVQDTKLVFTEINHIDHFFKFRREDKAQIRYFNGDYYKAEDHCNELVFNGPINIYRWTIPEVKVLKKSRFDNIDID